MAFERKIRSESIVIVQPDTARNVQFTLGTFIGARRRVAFARPTKTVQMGVEYYLISQMLKRRSSVWHQHGTQLTFHQKSQTLAFLLFLSDSALDADGNGKFQPTRWVEHCTYRQSTFA